MSTLPGQASKAEKTKSKFQSLDINSLYRVSRGENLEKQQQKSSSVYIKHGMQSLGKVPNARRAPANLPSLKAEHSGSDAAVPLVPPGAQGWGKQDASAAAPQATAAATAPAQSPSQSTAAPMTAAVAGVGQTPPQGAAQMSPHQAAIALPVTNPVPHPHKQLTPSAQPAPVDKLWSSVMSGQDVPHPPLYHSPQFQHEFPSLSAGDGGPTRTGSDAPQYPSGLSLRPQTEGSWTQGGTSPATGGDPAGPGRPNSVPPGAQTQPSAQGGQQPFPPQMRGVMPSFMYKGSGFQQQQAPGVGGQGAPPTNGRAHHRGGADGRPPRPGGPEREAEEAVPRPIIKEEELTRMDEIGKDMGWAESDEIDYNQKLAFSDDETDRGAKKDNAKRRPTGGRSDPKEERPVDPHPADGGQPQPRQRGGPRSGAAPRSARPAEEEDVWTQRRNQTDKEVELAVQRAKQRKEEEEKRFQEERKQAAAKKLMELEEKIQKRDRDISHEAPPEKEVDGEDKGGSSFRQLTQIEGKNFPQRKHAKPEGGRESGAPFSKNFQNDLPPRFLKHQRGNNNNNSSGQQQQQPQHQFDSRWSSQNAPKHQQQEHQQPAGNEKAAAAADRGKDKEEDTNTRRQAKEKPAPASDWGEQRRDKGREREDWSDHRNKERDRRDFLSAWSEPPSAYEHVGEEQRRREDRRAVPGPITRERVEAEDARGGGEKRGLTQLRRGQPVEVRSEIAKRPTEGAVEQPAAWADSIPAAIEEQAKKLAEATAEAQQQQKVAVAAEPAKKQQQQEKAAPSEDYNRGKPSYGQKKGWGGNSASGGGGGSDYHPPRGGQPWPGRGQHGRGRRGGGNDSDGSLDDRGENKAETVDHRQRSPKSTRRNDGGGKFGGGGGKPAERQRENYVPRGEPSRHGRGGGNFRSGRMASMGKKIDGYGPPPAKSPFGGGHHPFDDKERRTEGATAAVEGAATTTPSTATVEDKIKQNQQALAAGIIGKRADTDGGGNKAAAPRSAKPEPRKNGNNKPNNEVDDAARRPPVQGGKVPSGGGRPAPAPNRGGRGEKPNSKQSSDATPSEDGKSEGGAAVGDSEGFQEVKSKKAAVKERQKSSEDKPRAAAAPKNDATAPASAAPKDSRLGDRERGKSGKPQLTPQQIQNIPPLMATPVNPPPMLPKGGFDRGRQTSKLPPRFAKQKLQKQAMQQQQQQQHLCGDLISDLSKGGGAFPAPPPTCAWDKPLGSQLREAAPVIGDVKAPEAADKPLLDGSSAPVNTIIFENTNFKSAPGARPKSDDANGHMDGNGFGKPPHELLQQQQQQGKVGEGKAAEAASMHLPLFKADAADMKIDFFSADLQFGDDKASKNFVAKSIHAITSGNNTVDSLDIKIASVKKVWDTSEQEGEDHQLSFGGPPLDSNVFGQGKDTSVEDGHDGPNQSAQTNVCKVKPTQQVSGGGQSAMGSAHQPHAGLVAAGLMGNPLSPPPIPPQLGAAGVGVGMGPQYTANQHMGYQTGLSGSTQYGISAIPSPPAVPLVYNSSQQQQLQSAVQTAAGLYGAFQLDHQLGGQGRSQFSQYAGYHGLGQTATSPYSTPSVYLPTPPHPPPPAAQPPPPELYQNIGNFRLSATTPFGQSQQLSNPSTVLISSTSNSLMSASVKPSGQQISAIGTKAGGVGQAYQQQSQQGQQVYMTYDPSMQANYLASNAGVMQRPTQNNVVPGLQPSSSYYSGSTGGQTGFFQQPGNSAQMSQHQAGYGLQGNVFGTHNQSHTNNALQNYNSHFLTAPMQVAAALSAQQQFRSNLPAAAYMKGVGDQSGRSQQLKSPSSQEVLSSVFNSGPQIPSPKSRQNMKHPPQQSSPTSQHKYNMYQQGVGGPPPNMNMQRYPTPIQRPINFQQMQQNSVNQKHRNNPNSNKPSNNRYYGNQNHSLSSQSEKCDDAKIDGGANATGAAKSAATGADVVKDNLKEETVALKD